MEIDLNSEEIRLLEKALITVLNKSKKSQKQKMNKGYNCDATNHANECRKILLKKLSYYYPLDREYED